MLSRAERRSKAIWILAYCLGDGTDAKVFDGLRDATEKLKPFIPDVDDLNMTKIRACLLAFCINKIMGEGPEHVVTFEEQQSFLHMLNALVGDIYQAMPTNKKARKQAWLDLNNAVVELIEATADELDNCADVGCDWAKQIEEIIERN
jgi:hypothetical protein